MLQTPIIVISAKAFEQDQKESLEVGGNAFLPKPVDEQKLLALISQYVPFANQMRQLAREFEDDEIVALLERYFNAHA